LLYIKKKDKKIEYYIAKNTIRTIINMTSEIKNASCHDICECIREVRKGLKHGGVSVAILNNYYDNETKTFTPVILLGREDHDDHSYYDQLNICGGSVDDEDNNCYLLAALRELREEFHMDFDWSTFDKYFKDEKGIRLVFVNKTPIFVGVIIGWSRDNNNKSLKRGGVGAHCEMSSVTWVKLSDAQLLDNKVEDSSHCNVSDYSKKIINTINETFEFKNNELIMK
jgi:8-oxo-dGTP pyrophosphatase MutT (NUDIX family)